MKVAGQRRAQHFGFSASVTLVRGCWTRNLLSFLREHDLSVRPVEIKGLKGLLRWLGKASRMEAAVAHRKWIDAAHYLGCHAIRCNLRGGLKEWQKDKDIAKRGAEAFQNMLEYSKGSGLSIILENHGGASSDPDVLTELMGLVKDQRFGMLVDTGNWNPGVDRYEAVRRMMPYAKGVSAKGTWGFPP